jgi:hypothetical protein
VTVTVTVPVCYSSVALPMACPRIAQAPPPPLPRCVALNALAPTSSLTTNCGRGYGLAVCSALGILATSCMDDNTLSLFALRGYGSGSTASGGSTAGAGAGAGAGTGMVRLCTMGGASSPPPMQFNLSVGGGWAYGFLAFTDPVSGLGPLLLVSDFGNDAVHVIDVDARVHAGYVAAPGRVAGPRGVAAKGTKVAVSAWKKYDSGDHVVHLFEGSGARWVRVRVVAGGFGRPGGADGQLNVPYGLRFTCDGAELVVADNYNKRVSVFRVEDGTFARHVATGMSGPMDVEECEGGWLVACIVAHTVELVGVCVGGSDGDGGGGGGAAKLGRYGTGIGQFATPGALALVPGLGLIVREAHGHGRAQVFQ